MIGISILCQLVAMYSGFLDDLVTVKAISFPATMLTRGSSFVLDPGSSLDLDCMFAYDEYSVFKNPIVWKKKQLKEVVPINLNKNIYPPFLNTKRFEISLNVSTSSTTSAFHAATAAASLATATTTTAAAKFLNDQSTSVEAQEPGSGHKMTLVHEQLRLSNVTTQDTGDYICEVKGSQSVVMATVTHHVIVRASVQKLVLFVESTRKSRIGSLNSHRVHNYIHNHIHNYNYIPRKLQPDPRERINTWRFKTGKDSTDADGISGVKGRLPEVIITQGRPRGLGCTATGGSPAPEVKIFVGNKEITDFFALERTLSLISSSEDDDDDEEEEEEEDEYHDGRWNVDSRSGRKWKRQLSEGYTARANPDHGKSAENRSRRSIGWSPGEVKRLPRGLQVLRWSTRRWSGTGGGLHLRDELLDGQVIKCIAAVSGLTLPPEREPVAVARVTMHYAPKITCLSTSTRVGEKNVNLSCQVRSKPDLIALFWTTDPSGTVVSPNEGAEEFWSVNRVKNDSLVETTLRIRHVTDSHFRSYRLVAENVVSTAAAEVHVTRKNIPDQTGSVTSKIPKTANHVAASTSLYDIQVNGNGRHVNHFLIVASSGTKIDFWIFQSSLSFVLLLSINFTTTVATPANECKKRDPSESHFANYLDFFVVINK